MKFFIMKTLYLNTLKSELHEAASSSLVAPEVSLVIMTTSGATSDETKLAAWQLSFFSVFGIKEIAVAL